VLRLDGIALLNAPINPTRQTTYEDASVTDPVERTTYLSGPDHCRFYGLDFSDRLTNEGFSVAIFRLTQADEVFYGPHPMERLYVATRPSVTGSGPDLAGGTAAREQVH
jgi:hypothetical protein